MKKQRLTQTISLVPGREQAGAARDGRISVLCTQAPLPTAKSDAETPHDVSTSARPTQISTLAPVICRHLYRLALQRQLLYDNYNNTNDDHDYYYNVLN